MSEKRSTKVPLSPILRAALASRQPGEDLDEALLRALKTEHPHEAVWLLSTANEMIDLEAQLAGGDREQTVQRLAAAESGPEITVRNADFGPLHMSFQSTVYRVGGKEYRSLDELPPKIRVAIEAALSEARRALGAAGSEGKPELPATSPTMWRDDRPPVRIVWEGLTSEKQPDTVPLSPILRAALSSRQPGEDLDEAILRALKAVHPEHAAMLLSAATDMIDKEVKRTGEGREQVVKRLAAEEPGPVVGARAGDFGSLHVSARSPVLWVGGKEYRSLDEMPEDLRRAVEAALPPDRLRMFEGTGTEAPLAIPPNVQHAIEERRRQGDKVRVVRGAGSVRTGCSMALLAALWKLVWR